MNEAEFIEFIRLQILNPDTSQAQREANEHRLMWLKILSREKNPNSTPVFYDAVFEALVNPGVLVNTSSLLNTDK